MASNPPLREHKVCIGCAAAFLGSTILSIYVLLASLAARCCYADSPPHV